MKSLKTVVCFCFLLLSVSGYALDKGYRKYTSYNKSDGLLSNTIDYINQDSEGYMYFCTNKGLSIFDGNIFNNYNSQNLPGFSNFLESILELDSLHLLIASRDKGLFVFDKRESSLHPALGDEHFFKSLNIKTVIKSANGALWLGCDTGDVWYVSDVQKIIRGNMSIDDIVKIPYAFPTINELFEINGTIYLAGQSNELYAIHGTKGTFAIEKVAQIPDVQSIHSFLLLSEERLWIGTDNGISELKRTGDKWTLTHRFAGEIGCVRCMTVCNNRIFVGTEGMGIIEVSSVTKKLLRIDNNQSQKYVITLKTDRNGNLWAGTWMGGAECFQFSESLVSQYKNESKKSEMFANVVWNLFQTDEKEPEIYLGTQGGGLCTLDKSSSSMKTLNDKYKSVWSIYADTINDHIYVGTWGNGLRLFNPVRKVYEPLELPALEHERIVSITRRNDHELFIGTSANGLWLYNEASETVKPLKFKDNTQNVIVQLNVRKIEKNQEGKGYWMGTFNSGIFLFDLDEDDTVEILAHHAKVDDNLMQITSFLQADSCIWMCTTNGLVCLDSKKNGGLPYEIPYLKGSYLSDIYIKENGLIFIASQDGLLIYNPENKYCYGCLNEHIVYRILNKEDELILATSQGVLSFNCNMLEKNFKDGKPIIRSLSINGTSINPIEPDGRKSAYINEAINYVDTLEIPAGNHNVKFMLSTLSFNNLSASNTLFYKMEGLDSYWSKAVPQDPYAEYRRLPSGEYKLHVRFNTSDNAVNERVLTVIKHEYWWKTSVAIACYIILLSMLVVYLIVYFRFRYKRRYQEQYKIIQRQKADEIYEQKVRFFTNISHDLKTPLTLLISPLLDLSKHPEMPEMFQTRLQSMILNGNLLLKKIDKILNYRNLYNENANLTLEMYPVHQSLYEIIVPFKEYAERQGIDFKFSQPLPMEKGLVMNTDKDKLESILENLISNAIKYTPEGGSICVEYSIVDTDLNIKIADTGKGIDANDLPYIFDRYFRISSDNSGTGIGLYLVKHYVDLLKGTIQVDSTVSAGTSFVISLPLNIHKMSEEEPVPDNGSMVQQSEDVDKENLLKVLIVDDNKELREYLNQLLSPFYEVLEASDGQQALDILHEVSADIIISDLVMSGMDGFELCKTIKSNIQTSHIPFIILSAKGDVDTRIEGWNAGVDLYEQKPFNSQLLLTNVSNLLKSRRLLKYKYQLATPAFIMGEKKEQEEKNLEKQFMDELNVAIEHHMDNPDLSVSELAEELHMSQEQFYHKLKTLSGYSPNQYIRTYRLNCAAAMLRSKKYMVTEVLYSVGFNNPSYFTKCFKKQFGVLPSEYVNNTDEENEIIS